MQFILDACRGKKVLDLGALDETAFTKKAHTGDWLHEAICAVASTVVGLDNSAAILDGNGMITAPNGKIYRGDVFDVESFLKIHSFIPEIVVCGELIEHLANPLEFLLRLRQINALKGARLIITTPNATALHNCLIALFGMESTHKDHLHIFSYKTLNTLMARANFSEYSLVPYFSNFVEMKLRVNRFLKFIIAGAEAGVNLSEFLFPLLSFGWVIDAPIYNQVL